MVKRIVLHVGAPKAGSTYLQRRLRTNADILAAHNVYYPVIPQFQKIAANAKTLTIALEKDNAAGFTRNFPDVDISKLDPSEELEKLIDLCPDGIETAIISSEKMKPHHAKALSRLMRNDVRCEVVLCIRRQDNWMDSYLNHFIINNYMTNFEQAFADILNPDNHVYCSPDWLYHFKEWTKYFGRVKILFFDDMHHTFFDQLVEFIGFETGHSFRGIEIARPSAPIEALAYLSRFSVETPLEEFSKHRQACDVWAYRLAQSADLATKRERFTLLSSKHRHALIDQYSEANRELLESLEARDELLHINSGAINFTTLEAARETEAYGHYVEGVKAVLAEANA